MFKWKIEPEQTFQCPIIQHAVGHWNNDTDYIFAFNNDWIFTISAESRSVLLLEQRKNFAPVLYPAWQELLPQLSPNVLVSDLFFKFCSNEPNHYFVVDSHPKMLFSPKSITFSIDGVLDATFLHLSSGAQVVLLFQDRLLISKCADWWQSEHLNGVSVAKNDGNYLKLISVLRFFIAYGEHCIAGFDKTATRVWQNVFEEKIIAVWLLESCFQVAILFSNGQLTLLDRQSGQCVVEKPLSFSLFDTAHVVVKNSKQSNGNAFYIISQKFESQTDQHQTMIREISAKRIPEEFVQPKSLCLNSL